MKKFIFSTFIAFTTTLLSHQTYAQGVVSAPLFVFTDGSGTISPFQYGQLLEVGQSYEMTATPDTGFVFSSWQPANVFTSITYVIDGNGDTVPISSIYTSLVPTFTAQPVLDFTMQPVAVIYDNPGVSTITESSGWQANFEPVPEPASLALIFSGLTVFVFYCRKRFREDDHAA